MDHKKITKFDEAKAYFKTLWKPMESELILENLKKILNFLLSSADEICFVNMQEEFLPFYYMIFLDDEFLQTTFFTDECKVVANEILRILEASRNSFTWEVSFSRQIAGIPVMFKKVYTKPSQSYPTERDEKPIRSGFKEIWVKSTLQFIKSSRTLLKYPEMPRKEAQYLFRGILKLNDEDLEPDSMWSSVWEALNIFKLRYEYIVSLHSTASDYLKFVQFEKTALGKRQHAIVGNKSIVSMHDEDIISSALDETYDFEEREQSENKSKESELETEINHQELVKTLLEMKVTKSGTIVYTLKINESNTASTDFTKDVQIDVKSPDENIIPKTLSLFEIGGDVSLTIPRNKNSDFIDEHRSNPKTHNLNKSKTEKLEVGIFNAQNANNIYDSYFEISNCFTNTDGEIEVNTANMTASEDIMQTKSPSVEPKQMLHTDIGIESANAVKADENSTEENFKESELNDSHFKKAVQKMVSDTIDDISNGNMVDSKKIEMEISNEKDFKTDITSVNPFIQQILNLQRKDRPLYLSEEEFKATYDTSEPTYTTNFDNIQDDIRKTINPNHHSINEKSEAITPVEPTESKKEKEKIITEVKTETRLPLNVIKKCRLVNSLTPKFLLTSFQTLLEFVSDDLRASLEMIGLNIHEFNFLKKLHCFSPTAAPIEEIFDEPVYYYVVQMFETLKMKHTFSLEVKPIPLNKMKKKAENPSHASNSGETRHRSVVFRKKPFKKSRKTTTPPITETTDTEVDSDLKQLRNPRSILEKMLKNTSKISATSPRSSVSRPRSDHSLERYRGARSPSVSPTRPKQKKTEAKKFKEVSSSEKTRYAGKLPGVPLDVQMMKSKLIEGLSVPLEIDKAMRMMRLMGWKGGALGVRGEGLTEPLLPRLDVLKGVGLGHVKHKTPVMNMPNVQKDEKKSSSINLDKTKIDRESSEKIYQANHSHKESVVQDNVNEKRRSIPDEDGFAKPGRIKRTRNEVFKPLNDNTKFVDENRSLRSNETIKCSDDVIESNKKSVAETAVSKDYSKENASLNNTTDRQKINENLCKLINDGPEWTMKSVIDTDSNYSENVESCWLTNDSLIQMIKNNHASNERKDNPTIKSNIETNCEETYKIPIVIRRFKVVTEQSDAEKIEDNRGMLNNQCLKNGEDSEILSNDLKLLKYTRESQSRHLSHKSQFLVNLLDLLQNGEKNYAIVNYEAKPKKQSIRFINWTLSCLNRRIEPEPITLREHLMLAPCVREMDAHSLLSLSFQLKNITQLILIKTNGDETNIPSDFSKLEELKLQFQSTHIVKDDFYENEIPPFITTPMRDKMIINRFLLEFLKSDDNVRVYYLGKKSNEIRFYIISIVSLLNRQMTRFQLGLGSTDEELFREMVEAVENFGLIARFDTLETSFKQLQLVKIDITKRCRLCQITLEASSYIEINNQSSRANKLYKSLNSGGSINIYEEETDHIDDIELYPNQFNNSNSDSNNKSIDDVNNDVKMVEDKASHVDNTDEIKSSPQYLAGENWSNCDWEVESDDSDHGIKMNSVGFLKKNIPEIKINDFDGNTFIDTTQNVSDDLHKKSKRFKKDETNNNIDENNRNIIKILKNTLERIAAKKIATIEEISVKKNTENIANSSLSDEMLIVDTDNHKDKIILLSNEAVYETSNLEGICENNVVDNPETGAIYDEKQTLEENNNNNRNKINNNVMEVIYENMVDISVEHSKNELQFKKTNVEEIYENIYEDITEVEPITDRNTNSFQGTYEDFENIDIDMEESYQNNVVDVVDNNLLEPVIEITKANNSNLKKETIKENWPKTILIVHYNYPKTNIDSNKARTLQSALYKEMTITYDSVGYLPQLKCCGLKNSGIIYICFDRDSYIWLCEKLPCYYKFIDFGEALHTKHIIQMKINSFIGLEITVIFETIEKYYDDINTSLWKVLETKIFEGYFVITVEVDEVSLKNIRKEEYSLFVGIDKADISVLYD